MQEENTLDSIASTLIKLNSEYYDYIFSLGLNVEKTAELHDKHQEIVNILISLVKDRIQKSQKILSDTMLNIQYQAFDLECTKREKEQLEKRLKDLEN